MERAAARRLAGLAVLAALAGCASSEANKPAASRPAAEPARGIVVTPGSPPQASPLAPESVPDKPQPIPEQMPGTKPPR